MQISAVIITFNEERNIGRCLSSLNGVCDEIIVVDSLSTDRTKEICLQYPLVKFFEQKFLGYSAQKNYANKLASYDNILSIDADEALSEQLKQSIIDIKALYDNTNSSGRIFAVKRLTNYCGSWIKHSGWYPDTKQRIFHKSFQWVGEIHETLIYPSNVKTQTLKGDLFHYTVYNSSEHIKQIDKFTTLLAKQSLEKGKKANGFDLWFRPKWKFFRDYIINRGFLDGSAGYQVCKMSAFATFLKYAKIKESNK
jgi:glycosyltransferase involved in cell wall biosynthesis